MQLPQPGKSGTKLNTHGRVRPPQELVIEGCPLLTHQPLRAAAEAAAEARRPLLGALRVLDLSQSAGGWVGGRVGKPQPQARYGLLRFPLNRMPAVIPGPTPLCTHAPAFFPPGARSDFALHLERLQFAAPALRELRLNGLCGAYAWSFNAAPGQVRGMHIVRAFALTLDALPGAYAWAHNAAPGPVRVPCLHVRIQRACVCGRTLPSLCCRPRPRLCAPSAHRQLRPRWAAAGGRAAARLPAADGLPGGRAWRLA